MIRISCVIVSAVLLSCTPRAEPVDSMPSPSTAQNSVTGTVAVVGSAPMNVQVVLRTPEGPGFQLAGPLAEEVRQLSGAVVRVWGRVGSTPDPMAAGRIEVADYDIVSVDGAPVVMGEIVAIDGARARLRTRTGEEVYLSGAPGSFQVGQKVWVQGPSSIAVQSYGTIRP